jgi:serine/threonine protein kinase
MINPNELTREEIVGQGSYATVYRGTWNEKTVAIKVLNFDIPLPPMKSVSNSNVPDLFRDRSRGASGTNLASLCSNGNTSGEHHHVPEHNPDSGSSSDTNSSGKWLSRFYGEVISKFSEFRHEVVLMRFEFVFFKKILNALFFFY